MKHRKLRIAWSVAWGIVAMVLIALWVRSYKYLDSAQLLSGHPVSSVRGRILIGRQVGLAPLVPNAPIPNRRMGIVSRPLIAFNVTFGGAGVALPFWSATLLSAVMMSAFWFPDRFSLRTLLIATTLVAAGLGLIVWATK
jgi:hypothetical protein